LNGKGEYRHWAVTASTRYDGARSGSVPPVLGTCYVSGTKYSSAFPPNRTHRT